MLYSEEQIIAWSKLAVLLHYPITDEMIDKDDLIWWIKTKIQEEQESQDEYKFNWPIYK